MALCDFLLESNISNDCTALNPKGAQPDGLLINRSDINLAGVTYDSTHPFEVTALPLKGGKVAYDIVQSGKTPWNGTQQEVVAGTYQNTFTNTVQFVILKQDATTANQVFGLMNGTFVVVMKNKMPDGNQESGNQVYGLESGLRASAMVRELYNDDTLSGWLVTMTEENAVKGNLFISDSLYATLKGE